MTIYIIEADGEVIAETGSLYLAESMFEAAQAVYDTVTMHEEHVAETLH